MSQIESFRISGSPDPHQEKVIIAALEKMLRDEVRAQSRWKTAARAEALGLGAGDLRSKGGEVWRASQTSRWQRGGPQDLRGRGDAK